MVAKLEPKAVAVDAIYNLKHAHKVKENIEATMRDRAWELNSSYIPPSLSPRQNEAANQWLTRIYHQMPFPSTVRYIIDAVENGTVYRPGLSNVHPVALGVYVWVKLCMASDYDLNVNNDELFAQFTVVYTHLWKKMFERVMRFSMKGCVLSLVCDGLVA